MNRANHLLLTEILIMVLVFSLASAITLQVFFKSNEISNDSFMLDKAVIFTQSLAEELKHNGGNLAKIGENFNLKSAENQLKIYLDEKFKPENQNWKICVFLEKTEETKYIGTINIRITDREDKEIFSLPVSYMVN